MSKNIAGFIFLTLILSFTVNMDISFSAELQLVPGQAIKIQDLTKNQFKSLPDNAVIEVNGIQMTKQQLITVQKQKRNQLTNLPKPSMAKPQFDAARTKFLQDQQNKINADNARVKAAFDSQVKLNSANNATFAAIQKEALELSNKSKNATPEQQQQIEQRAKDLVDQLKQMGYK
jgi:hypothetical protein